ncbi:MAG: hypothetical protein KGN98_00035 [Alphaproteobacteria bacterium]|jgi:hypothetical protein|nr:hypothetical protein [Alphaproteobacteria bacterium]
MSDHNEKPEDNETVRAVKRARARAEAAAESAKKPINWKAAAGIGIGSAAILGALIYATRNRDKSK